MPDIGPDTQEHGLDCKQPAPPAKRALQALTAAALLLPGLAAPAAKAADTDEAGLQYSRYQEEKRDLQNGPSSLKPIVVDSLRGAWQFELSERSRLSVRYTQDTWSGATPITTAPLAARGNRPIRTGTAGNLVTVGASPFINGQVLLDSHYTPLQLDPITNKVLGPNTQLVHTMASASPETRLEGEVNASYTLNQMTMHLGGGLSQERDYTSQFVNGGLQGDLNEKLTQFNLGLRYATGEIAATLDHDAAPYITKTAFQKQISTVGSQQVLHGDRHDFGLDLGLSQVLDKNSVLQVGVGYTRSGGYLSNPYRVMTVIFVDPTAGTTPSILTGNVQALLEQRPDLRSQWNVSARYAHFMPAQDAALHLGYRYFGDDWHIRSHTLDAEWRQALSTGWTLTPSLRYYSQTAASFYQPYLVSPQAYRKVAIDADENVTITPFNPQLLPSYFSSDPRLSAFGSLSGGLTLSKQFSKGIRAEAGIEYYKHAGALKLGGGGESSYADYAAATAHVALQISLNDAGLGDVPPGDSAGDHQHHHQALPAGVLAGHMLAHTGELMVGYRYMDSRDGGAQLLHGADQVNDQGLLREACGKQLCYSAPGSMKMRMHMLDLMYAPSDRLTLMLMPQFVDMDMAVRDIAGAPPPPVNSYVHHHDHATGGLGDTELQALFGFADTSRDHLHVGLGISIPTGDAGIRLRRSHQSDPGFIDYGMQLGSGTWDFKPSVTYTGQAGRWNWGSQLNARLRLQDENKFGYALGNSLQASAWAGYAMADWLGLTLRGVYTRKGGVRGEYNDVHPQTAVMDFADNYGGRFQDLGLGLNITATRNQSLGVEWLQPVSTKVNGYQLDRQGTFTLAWSSAFN